MKTLHKLLAIITIILLWVMLTAAILGYIYTDGEENLAKTIIVLQLSFILCVGIMLYQWGSIQKLRKAVGQQKKNAAIPYCCPGHDFSCPYVSSPYQKSKDCSECENSSDLIKVWVLHNSAWDDKNCPHSVMRYAGAECYMAKIIALKEAKETKKIGIGSCVFVNGIGGYYELVSKVKL